jgi:hypothetical protein
MAVLYGLGGDTWSYCMVWVVTHGRTGHRLRLQTTVFRKLDLSPSSRGKWEKLNILFQALYKQLVPIP